jgi:predicted PurR-regulated permease PerM
MDWARLRDQSIVAVAGLLFAGVVIWLLGHVIGIVALVAVAAVLALVLEPLMCWAERWMPRMAAALSVYAITLGAVALVAFFFGPVLVRQASQLAQGLPHYIDRADAWATSESASLGHRLPPGTVRDALAGATAGAAPQQLLLQFVGVATKVAEVMADVVVVLVLAFYFMVDGNRMQAGLLRLFPARHRPKVRFVQEAVAGVLAAYVRSQVVMAALMGGSAAVGCWLLGVRYPAVIGTLAFLAELVPLIGPFLAAVPAMLIAVFQSFGLMVEVTFFFVGMQMLENSVVRPRITGPMVGLHPVEALLALLVGASTAGFWGALFAVPAAGIGVILVTVVWRTSRGEPQEFERRGMRLRMLTPEQLDEAERSRERARSRHRRRGPA